MRLKKTDGFKYCDQALSNLAKALSHPARIAILRLLSGENCCICSDIVKAVPLAQSTVSQHLNELKRAGLINIRQEGVKSFYSLNHETCFRLNQFFHKLIAELNCNCGLSHEVDTASLTTEESEHISTDTTSTNQQKYPTTILNNNTYERG